MMAPYLLTPLTPEERADALQPLAYFELVLESGVDPEALWYSCACLKAESNVHDDACWLGWLTDPQYAPDPIEPTDNSVTHEIPAVDEETIDA
jgi:hypothetical protein